MKQEKYDDPELIAEIQALRTEEPRDPQKAAEGKTAFIAEARQLSQSVSKTPPQRHNIWKGFLAPIFLQPRREGFSMMNIALLAAMVFGLVFGGGGITVSAAQGSMPDDALYGVKLATERVRLQFAGEDEAEFQLALQFADRRIEEAAYMFQNGEAPDEALMKRIQEQNENCLRLALGLPEDMVLPALLQLQEQFRQQLRLMEQLQIPEDAALEGVQLRLRTTLEQHLYLAELGEGDQLQLHQELQIRDQDRINQLENDALRNEEQNQNQIREGSGDGSDGSNGSPWVGESATPGNGEESGESKNPWTEETPTPGSGYGEGESQNPWTTTTPTPGSDYGPGPGGCETCTPQFGTPKWDGSGINP